VLGVLYLQWIRYIFEIVYVNIHIVRASRDDIGCVWREFDSSDRIAVPSQDVYRNLKVS